MSETPWAGRRLHFVGIGGAGMSGLALVAAALGATVAGSDRGESSYVARPPEAGVEPALGPGARPRRRPPAGRRRRRARLLDRGWGREPGACPGARARPRGAAPRGCPG